MLILEIVRMFPKRTTSDADKALLRQIYYEEGHFLGRDSLFKIVQKRFPESTISRRMIADFLERQEVQQIYRRPVTKVKGTKPIVSKESRRYIQVDGHDVGLPNRGYRYLVGARDVNSGRFYCEAVKTKRADETARAMAKILDDNDLKNISVLQVDNGTEFFGEFVTEVESRGIKIVRSIPRAPQSNSYIESGWRLLSGIMFRDLYARNSTSWLPYLQKYVDVINNTYNRNTGFSANDADLEENEEAVRKRRVRNVKKAYKHVEKELDIGDTVRVRLKGRPKYAKSHIPYYSRALYMITQKYEGTEVSLTNYQIARQLKDRTQGQVQKGRFNISTLQFIPGVEYAPGVVGEVFDGEEELDTGGVRRPTPKEQRELDELNRDPRTS